MGCSTKGKNSDTIMNQLFSWMQHKTYLELIKSHQWSCLRFLFWTIERMFWNFGEISTVYAIYIKIYVDGCLLIAVGFYLLTTCQSSKLSAADLYI